ncbi:MAG: DUF1592 domain-containing protein [Pirellula sp.]
MENLPSQKRLAAIDVISPESDMNPPARLPTNSESVQAAAYPGIPFFVPFLVATRRVLFRRSSLFMVVFCQLVGQLSASPNSEIEIRPFLQKHCFKCHSGDKHEGDFRIDNLSQKIGIEDVPQWAEIMERISSGEMPPKTESPLPTPEQSVSIVSWLANKLQEGEASRMAARGRVSYNRLTREEYVHTVRDLIGVHFDATDPGGFLEDPEWRGLERLGSVLTLSASNMEKYLTAAETIIAEAYPKQKPVFLDSTKPALLEKQIDESHRERLRSLGLLDKVRFEMWPGDIFRYSAPQEPLPEAGIYEITYKLSGLKPEQGRAPRLFVYEQRLDRVLFEQDVIAPEDQPTHVSFRAHLPKGRPQINVINDVPGPSNNPRAGRHGRKPFISIADGRIPWQIKLTDEQGQPRYPFLIIDEITFRGPIITDEEQRRRNEYMPLDTSNLEQVRFGLAKLARRAFRRPVESQELDRFMEIVRVELAAGEKSPDAVKAGMLGILCSKSFLFVVEGDQDQYRHQLNDWELATRLSYLLWSTMPDEQLFDLAERGKLQDKTELKKQLDRMLADPRSFRFCDSFSAQWLNLRKVGRFPPDKKLYPEYDSHLEQSMIGESKAFFEEVLRSNLTLREFLVSDWTMLNRRLADFYGLKGVDTDRNEFKRVSLPSDSHRGGLLTQASILSLTSDGTRHRPVHRGVWLSESILGKSLPPPPANVDPIEPTPVDSPKATLRMKLQAHKHNPNCAACHNKMDPLGLAFENYDAIGRWRTEEVVDGTGPNPPIDASGTFPDGRVYNTPEEFKRLLLANMDAFQDAFIEKLATYGLRRTLSFDDRSELKSIAETSREHDYQLRAIMQAFVLSDLFQRR